ncbi:MAG: hypothetical protein IKF19_02365 [Bacilli bacterium]|nr:hypothetical protein [Bacilli bacterium]
MKQSKIYLFKDRDDYIKKLTNDDIYNITGEKGSGKTYFGKMKDNDPSCTVLHLDYIFSNNTESINDSKNVRNILAKKYNTLNPDKFFEDKYYDELIKYLNNKNNTGYIEGGSIAEIEDVSKIKGTIVVKRTGVFKCFKRAVKRDYNNKYFMNLEKEKHKYFYKIIRFFKVIKRRLKIFKTYHKIEDFIRRIENYKN